MLANRLFSLKKHVFIFILLFYPAFNICAQQISPYLFGQNMWLTDGSEGRPGYIDRLWSKIEASGVKIVRIGGIGYDKNMPSIETLTKWVTAIKAIGAEPLLQVSQFQSAEQAAALVKHFNKDHDLKVTFWSIGNESFHVHHKSAEQIAADIKSHGSAMKSIDPSIKIFVPDLAWYNVPVYQALLGGEQDVSGKDKNGNFYMDGVTFHNYPHDSSYVYEDVVFKSAGKIEGMILNMMEHIKIANEKHNRQGDTALQWALTEFNITYQNPSDMSAEGVAVPSFINGQFWAEIFGLAMKYKAFAATPWCIQESDRQSTYFGYIGGPPDFVPHSTYYHMQMMAENVKGNFVESYTNQQYVKSICTVNDKQLVILLMNQSRQEDFTFIITGNKDDMQDTSLKVILDVDKEIFIKGLLEKNSSLLIVHGLERTSTQMIHYSLQHAQQNKLPELLNNY